MYVTLGCPARIAVEKVVGVFPIFCSTVAVFAMGGSSGVFGVVPRFVGTMLLGVLALEIGNVMIDRRESNGRGNGQGTENPTGDHRREKRLCFSISVVVGPSLSGDAAIPLNLKEHSYPSVPFAALGLAHAWRKGKN